MRLRGFDGLRAVAATAIVLLHVTAATGASVSGPLSIYFARLDFGVAIFFAMSGFLLYRPFAAAHLGAGNAVDVRRFYRRRAVRIYPAYWVALTVTIVVLGDAHIRGTGQYVLQYLLLQIYTPKLLAGIVPAWTLAVEVSFYALLPLYALVVRRLAAGRVRVELAAAGLVYVVSLAGRAVLGAVDGTDTYRLKWLPFMADWFALGIALAVVAVACERGTAGPRVRAFAAALGRMPWVVALVAVGAFVVAAHLGLPTRFASGSVAQDVARQICYGISGAALVALVAFRGPGADGPRRVFDARAVALLGIVSYGIFLWHFPLLTQIEQWGFLDDVQHGTTAVLFVTVMVAATAVAACSWIALERPLLRGAGRGPRSSHRPEPARD